MHFLTALAMTGPGDWCPLCSPGHNRYACTSTREKGKEKEENFEVAQTQG